MFCNCQRHQYVPPTYHNIMISTSISNVGNYFQKTKNKAAYCDSIYLLFSCSSTFSSHKIGKSHIALSFTDTHCGFYESRDKGEDLYVNLTRHVRGEYFKPFNACLTRADCMLTWNYMSVPVDLAVWFSNL